MSTSTPTRPRSLTSAIGIPSVRDVRLPGVLARRPPRLVAGVGLLVLLALSAFIRSRELSGELWFNEAIAVGIASRSFAGVLHAAHVGGSAPLYYVLLHLWLNVVGSSEADARALSLLCALLSIPVAAWAGRSLSGARAGFYGATLFAFAAVLTEYAEQAQPYALLILLSLVAVTAFLHGFVYRRRRYLWLFVGALEAALYTQGSAALLGFGIAVALLVVVRCAPETERAAIIRDAALCLGALVLLYLPWLPSTIDQIAHATSPWHYVPLAGATVPADLLGGERVDAALLIALVLAAAPGLLVKSRRREPAAVALWALVWIAVAALALAGIASLAAPDWVARYFGPEATVLLLLGTLAAARTRIVGFAAVLLCVIFTADPAAYAAPHMSDMRDIASALAPQLHPGDEVVVAQPEQVPLAWYYMPSGLRYASTTGPVSDPRFVDWDGADTRLRRAAPAATLGRLIASLSPGQQLLFVRPLTEGAEHWKSSWASLVRLRAAQWGQLLTADVARGTLTAVGTAPDSYPGDCCIADSAVLYRKAS